MGKDIQRIDHLTSIIMERVDNLTDMVPTCPKDLCWSYAPDPVVEQAAQEEGLDVHRISRFGQLIRKFPRSQVEKILGMNHTKAHKFNFQGAATGTWRLTQAGRRKRAERYQKNRKWVLDFARQHFRGQDYLKIT